MPELSWYIRLAMEVLTAGCSVFSAVMLACRWYNDYNMNLKGRREARGAAEKINAVFQIGRAHV